MIFIDPRQWKCIIFAIYCLPLSSVCAQHLLLYKKPLKDLLPYEDIHSILLQMLTKVFHFPLFPNIKIKRGTKPDHQQAVDELTSFVSFAVLVRCLIVQ